MNTIRIKHVRKGHGKIASRHAKAGKNRAKKGFLGSELRRFISSFKSLKPKSIFVGLYDILFYLMLFILFSLWGFLVKAMMPSDLASQIQSINSADAQLLQSYIPQIQAFMLNYFISMFVLALLVVLAWSVSRGLIWNFMTGNRLNVKYLGKFYLLNLLWLLICFIAVAIFLVPIAMIKTIAWLVIALAVLLYIVAMFIVYFTTILYISFTKSKEKRVFSSLKSALAFGSRKLKHFIIPGMLTIALFVLMNLVVMLADLLPEYISLPISMLLLIAFLVWFRHYFMELFNSAEKAG